MTGRDVIVVGDGPAGSALSAALCASDVDALLVGRDDRWTATYGGWVDDLDRCELTSGRDVWAVELPSIRARFAEEVAIDRAYGVLDNDRLRAVLRDQCVHHIASVEVAGRSSVRLDDGTTLDARAVIDATGWPPRFARSRGRADVAWQTAFGIVLPEPPGGALGAATLMDYTPVPTADDLPPTFAYVLPVADGWLVEETVLAGRPAIEPTQLRDRLATRLETTPGELLGAARRVEEVWIPMGAPPPDRSSPVLAYGAAGGMIQPTTGYSVTASIRAAESTAQRISAALSARSTDPADELRLLHRAIWPTSRLRTRALHEYGLDVLLGLDDDGLREFFSAFFALSIERWSTFLRIDSSPSEVAEVMRAMFSDASWSLRRRLLSGSPRSLAGLARR